MRIVALDFETANHYLQSACSLGISIYEDGEIIDSFEWYFKPHPQYNYFTNTHIHGISEEDVINEEEFVFYYEQLTDILKDSIIIAHNASFDINVLNSICDLYGLDHFKNKYLDTVAISRKVYPELYNHKLDTVSKYLNIDLNHHNGQSDAFACLMILLKAMDYYQTYDLDEFLSKIEYHCKENM
jgi:DNA polymerase III subunit epsilon